MRPLIDSRVGKAGGHYDSIMGRISTECSRDDAGAFVLCVTLPANTTGRIHLPATSVRQITEGGRNVAECEGFRVISNGENGTLLEVGSGLYRFVVSTV